MEREIKFRAWDKRDNCILYDGQSDLLGVITNKGVMILDPQSEKPRYSFMDKDRFIVMQSTSLKDKNGVDIYEGDILKIESDKLMVVGWSKKFASFILNRDGWAFSHWFGESCDPSDCQIIGNIHENPKLLK